MPTAQYIAPEKQSPRMFVAAYNASAKEKAKADYVCDGIDDQVQIQQAIDAVAAYATGGIVELSGGTFHVLPHSATSRVTANDATAVRAALGYYYMKLRVSAENKALFSISDPIILTGGSDGGTKTLDNLYLDGMWPVVAITAAQASSYCGGAVSDWDDDTDLLIYSNIVTAMTSAVTYIRPRWALHLPPLVSLVGQGFGVTRVINGTNSNCITLKIDGVVTTGYQQVRNLSLIGDSSNNNPAGYNVREHTGLFTWGYDVHVRDVEIRYYDGYGLVVAQSWGFQAYGAWIEDCLTGVFGIGGRFNDMKIMQTTEHAIILSVGTVGSNGPWFSQCEVRGTTNFAPILLRGVQNFQFIGGCVGSYYSAQSCIHFVSSDGRANENFIVDTAFATPTNGWCCYVTPLSSAVRGGQLRGVVGNACLGIIGAASPAVWPNEGNVYLTGCDINVVARYVAIANMASKTRWTCVTNHTGGNTARGQCLAWTLGATYSNEVGFAAADGSPLFAGIAGDMPSENHQPGYLCNEGAIVALVDTEGAKTNIAVGSPLMMEASTGYLIMATAGLTVVAIARHASTDAKGLLPVTLLKHPFLLPA